MKLELKIHLHSDPFIGPGFALLVLLLAPRGGLLFVLCAAIFNLGWLAGLLLSQAGRALCQGLILGMFLLTPVLSILKPLANQVACRIGEISNLSPTFCCNTMLLSIALGFYYGLCRSQDLWGVAEE